MFLDENLQIRSFTPAITDIYGLISADIGRSLMDFVPRVEHMPPLPDPRKLRNHVPIEHTVVAKSGKAYIRRILPYVSNKGHTAGVVVTFNDVSRLLASEKLLASALDAGRTIVFEMDLKSDTTVHRGSLVGKLGLDKIVRYSEFVVRVHPNDQALFFAAFESCTPAHTTFTRTYRFQLPDGEWCWLFDNGEAIFDKVGVPLRIVGMHRDATEEVHSRMEIESRERQLKTITDAIPPAIAFVDQEEHYRFVNTAYAAQWNLPVEKIIGQTVRDIAGENNYVRIAPHLKKALSGERNTYDLTLRLPDHRIRYKEVTYVPEMINGSAEGVYVVVTDLTERKLMQTELADAKNRLELSLEVANVAPWNWNRHARDIVSNATLNRLFGFDSTATPKLADLLQRIDDSYRDEIMTAIEISMAPAKRMTRSFLSDGPTVKSTTSRARGQVRMAEDGRIEDFFGVVVDITERKRRELNIADREAHLRRVIDNMLGFVGVLDPDGTLYEASESALVAGGISRNDVVGRKFWECYWWCYDPSVAEQLRFAISRAASGERVRYDVAVRAAGDTRMMIDFMIVPVHDYSGQVTHLIPSGVDISERKQVESQYRETAERLESLYNSAIDGMVTIDARGIMLSVNPAAVKLFGYAADEMVGRNVKRLMPEPWHHQHDSYLSAYLQTGQARIIGTGTRFADREKMAQPFRWICP